VDRSSPTWSIETLIVKVQVDHLPLRAALIGAVNSA
jgi:hypothetical protein